jgi:SAM-dependent methyltransferase
MTDVYTLDNAWTQARERLGQLEAVHDPGSIRHLERLGVAEGWHCLEIGAGGGSVAAWLCQRVGSSGYVLATDIDTRFLESLDYPNLEVRRHNIGSEPLPEDSFDLVHGRLVLMHLPERERALQSMASALKPGGWLLVEEGDVLTWLPDARANGACLFSKGTSAFNTIQAAAGLNDNCGRRLLLDVRSTGLVDVDGEGRVPMIRAGKPNARMWQLTMTQRRDRITGAGLLTDEEMDQYLALFDDEEFVAMDYMVMAVWGRKAL